MTLGGLLAFGPVAGAQDQPKPDAPHGGRAGMEKIIEQLKLTDDQTAKVKPILKDQAEKMKALRDDTSISQEDRRPKMKEIHEATNAKLKAVLTEDQFAQWKKLSQMGGRGGRAAGHKPTGDAPTPPPAADDKK